MSACCQAYSKSIDFPDLTIAIVGNNAIVRHLWVSESELDGKVTNTKIGVLQVSTRHRICWHTIFICENPQWHGKPLKQLGFLVRSDELSPATTRTKSIRLVGGWRFRLSHFGLGGGGWPAWQV